ncbi:MAG: ABC transporter ATP-binding protein [Burkholderiaceae bacterium]
MTSPEPLLAVSQLRAFYGKSCVLHGVDLQVRRGEIVSLLGRNGAGRSSTLKAVMGLVAAQGSILWRGQPVLGLAPHEIARLGIGYVPESRDVFPGLSVEQNLRLGFKRRAGRWSLDDVYQMFGALRSRRDLPAGKLSGGEQQMLSLGRSLLGDPALLLVDEPTEGLAPRIVAQVAQFLSTLAAHGVAVLLVEQKLAIALQISQRLYVMGHGQIVFEGAPDELARAEAVRREWLEV